jgi:hypothetical protein
MAGGVEGIVDRRMGGEKPLGRGLGLEAHLLSLAFSDRQMAVFSAKHTQDRRRVDTDWAWGPT